jgi:4,5-DOPA dioxygenase extradiol
MPLVDALYVPNAPNLISPRLFGGAGSDTVRDLENLDLTRRMRPDVIIVVSPHWVSAGRFLVHVGERPGQVFDFSGFPPEISAVKFAPKGDPALATRLVARGQEVGIPVAGTTEWGLDHGAWAPLLHLTPGARVPVIPLSITRGSPREHMAWGRAIAAALSDTSQRAVLVGTGSITHSFSKMDPSPVAHWPEGERIEREIIDLILGRRYDELAGFDPRKWALVEPEGDLNPLFVVAGATGGAFHPRLVSTSQMWGAFGLTILEFDPLETVAEPR